VRIPIAWTLPQRASGPDKLGYIEVNCQTRDKVPGIYLAIGD